MTYLELARKLAEKAGISGTIASVAGQSGEFLRVVNWINEAWHDIQISSTNWDWMREDFSFDTTAAVIEYSVAATGVTDFSKWHTDSFRIYRTAVGVSDEQFLPEWAYQQFRNTYQYGAQTNGRPTVFAVKPKGRSLLLGLIPDDIYTVRGQYQKKATYLVASTDEPAMPEEYHMAIVHKARMKYAFYENAPEVMAEAKADFDMVMAPLHELQMEDFDTGQPLA